MAEIMTRAKIEEWVHAHMGETSTIMSAIALGLIVQLDDDHFAVPYKSE